MSVCAEWYLTCYFWYVIKKILTRWNHLVWMPYRCVLSFKQYPSRAVDNLSGLQSSLSKGLEAMTTVVFSLVTSFVHRFFKEPEVSQHFFRVWALWEVQWTLLLSWFFNIFCTSSYQNLILINSEPIDQQNNRLWANKLSMEPVLFNYYFTFLCFFYWLWSCARKTCMMY